MFIVTPDTQNSRLVPPVSRLTSPVVPNLVSREIVATAPVATPAPVANTITIPLAAGAIVTSVTVGVFPSYSPTSTPLSPLPGEFKIEGTRLIIYLRAGESTVGTVTVLYGSLPSVSAASTGRVTDPPDFYRAWNISGTAQISLSFGGHPSGNLSFTTQSSDRQTILSSLRVGTEVTIYGIALTISQITLTALPVSRYPSGLLEVNVSFEGKWVSYLDRVTELFSSEVQDEFVSRHLQQILSASSIPYSGFNPQLRVDQGSRITQAGNFLDQNTLAMGGQFIVLDDPTAIRSRPFGQTRVWVISDADLLGNFQLDYSGSVPNVFYPNNLSEIYNNTELILDYLPTSEETSEEDFVAPTLRTYREPLEDPANLPDEYKSINFSLKEPTYCFDMGGQTRTQEVVTRLGKSTLRVRRETYGFAYSASDVWDVSSYGSGGSTVYSYTYGGLAGISTGVLWKKVEDFNTTYYYDQSGYLYRILTRGWKLVRAKKETDALESLVISVDQLVYSGDPDQLAFLAARKRLFNEFIRVPYTEEISFTLASYSDYYGDVPDLDQDTKFVLRKTTSRESVATFFEPRESNTTPKAPISSGVRFFEEINLTIPLPQRKDKEYFFQTTRTQGAEGSQLLDTLKIHPRERFDGRPQIAERLESATQNDSPAVPALGRRILISTLGSTTESPQTDSINFPTNKLEEGLLGARTLSAISNTFSSVTGELRTIGVSLEVRPGDLLRYNNELFCISSVSIEEEITNGSAFRVLNIGVGEFQSLGVSYRYV